MSFKAWDGTLHQRVTRRLDVECEKIKKKRERRGKKKEDERGREEEVRACTRLDSSLVVHGVKYTLVFASYTFANRTSEREKGKKKGTKKEREREIDR